MSSKQTSLLSVFLITAAVLGAVRVAGTEPVDPLAQPRVFEIRTYTTEPGKLDALLARFRDHTTKLFEKHGIMSIGYWTPADEPRSDNTLIYIVAHPESRGGAKELGGVRQRSRLDQGPR